MKAIIASAGGRASRASLEALPGCLQPCAKYADAFGRISLAWRSAARSRSNSLRRSPASFGGPDRLAGPLSLGKQGVQCLRRASGLGEN